MNRSFFWLKLLLGMFCVANVVLGAMGLIGGDVVIRTAAGFYGATVNLNPQLNHVIRMLGAFVFTLGVLGGVAALNPVKNKAIINGIILLLLIRVLQRILFAKHIFEAFGISYTRNFVNMIFFFAIALALFLLRPRPERAE